MITRPRTTALTLIELLIAIALLALVSLGIYSLSTFAQHHTTTANRQAEVQNEVSLALDHMSKHISQAIGNAVNNPPINIVIDDATSTITGIRAFIDADSNGQSDPANDYWIAYNLNANRIQFCSQCPDSACTICPQGYQNINGRACILSPVPPQSLFTYTQNYVEVNLRGCWDPAQTNAICGTTDNPQVNMSARIDLPSVSVH
jgi:Tfp pilus assembly protein FimT